MQKVTREILLAKAAELLNAGTVNRVLGWKAGEFTYDVTPAVFTTAAELEKDFVYGPFSGANFSKYLVKETRKDEGKILVFLKPCDTYSFNQLLSEHRFDREKVYAVGIPCDGMADIQRVKDLAGDGVSSVECDGDNLIVHTLYDGDKTLALADCLAERCVNCKSKKHVAYDELIGESQETYSVDRFDEVRRIEAMSPEEKFAFFQAELSKCIRCNACRNVCPACNCRKCVFDGNKFDSAQKANVDSFEEKMFHIIRAFHVAGRCTDCGECSRVCPQGIPLHLFNRKFIKDINTLYGEYQAGADPEARGPLTSFTTEDAEPSVVSHGGIV